MKFYIKDGAHEKGPLTVDELKRLQISKTTMVRSENAENWRQAGDIQEFKRIFKRRFRFLKVLFILGLIGFAIQIYLNESQLNSSRVNPFLEEIEEPLPPPPSLLLLSPLTDEIFKFNF